MISTKKNRLDPSLLEPGELESVFNALNAARHPALVDEAGNRTDIPRTLYRQLLRVLRMMRDGRAIIMLPEEETFTTQAAANFLGVSRQHLVNLLESGKIPFHKVGTHRRVSFKDLLEFDKARNASRREALGKLGKEVDEAGLYDAEYTGDDD